MKFLRSSKGVTLVEVMVVSILVSVLAGATLAIMTVHNRELSTVAARSRMQLWAETMAEQIGRDVRGGSHVLASGETWSATATYSQATISEINIVNNTGAVIKIYRISNNRLQSGTPSQGLSDFNVGSNDIQVSSPTPFTVSSDRKNVSVRITLQLSFKGTLYQIPPRGDTFSCRN